MGYITQFPSLRKSTNSVEIHGNFVWHWFLHSTFKYNNGVAKKRRVFRSTGTVFKCQKCNLVYMHTYDFKLLSLFQQLVNALLMITAASIGLLCYFMGESKHKRAFLEAKQSLEVKMVIEEQSAEQVRDIYFKFYLFVIQNYSIYSIETYVHCMLYSGNNILCNTRGRVSCFKSMFYLHRKDCYYLFCPNMLLSKWDKIWVRMIRSNLKRFTWAAMRMSGNLFILILQHKEHIYLLHAPYESWTLLCNISRRKCSISWWNIFRLLLMNFYVEFNSRMWLTVNQNQQTTLDAAT